MIDVKEAKEKIRSALNPLIKNFTKIALFDFPNYGNVGDSAIWLGTIDYLNENAPSSKIVWLSDLKTINKNNLPKFDEDTLLMINGGGNFGDLWKNHQDHREMLIKNYPKNRIIQLPQSIYYQNESNFYQTKAIIDDHKDFHLLVRDQDSYQKAKYFKNTRFHLCPDMAFYIRHIPRKEKPRYDVVALIRTDKESSITKPENNFDVPIFDWLSEPKSLAIYMDSFMDRYPSINSLTRPFLYKRLSEERFKRGCKMLMQGNVVITDRLHAHIMCTLLGIQNIVLDNTYAKISRVLGTWDKNPESTYHSQTFKQALEKAKLVSSHEDST